MLKSSPIQTVTLYIKEVSVRTYVGNVLCELIPTLGPRGTITIPASPTVEVVVVVSPPIVAVISAVAIVVIVATEAIVTASVRSLTLLDSRIRAY